MADNPTPEPEEQPEGFSEADMRNMIGEELDSRFSAITDSFGGIVDGIVDRLKSEGGTHDETSLLEKIGGMIDEKLKGLPSGSKEEAKLREPKLRIFS